MTKDSSVPVISAPFPKTVLFFCVFFLIFLLGCAGTIHDASPSGFTGSYELGDQGKTNTRFQLKMGLLVDTVSLFSSDGTLGYQAVYSPGGRSFRILRLGGWYRIARIIDQTGLNPLQDSPASMRLGMIESKVQDYINQLLKSSDFDHKPNGKLRLELWVDPSGKVKHPLCLYDATGDPVFVANLLYRLFDLQISDVHSRGFTIYRLNIPVG